MSWSAMKRPTWIAILMLMAAGLTIAATPTKRMAEEGSKVDLETLIPKQFGEWRLDPSVIPLQVSPDIQAQLDRIYDQTIARTYVNSSGDRVMLSIAYGAAQTKALQVHRPEVCYTAQGFQVGAQARAVLDTLAGGIPVIRLVATSGVRREPITYWVTIGEATALGGLEQKLAILRYGLTGVIPDGMLVRVSSLSRNDESAYRLQSVFVRELLSTLPPEDRVRLVGRLA